MYEYRCSPVRAIDADTIALDCDLGFGVYHTIRCRLAGVDCPEIRGGNERTRAAGEAAKVAAERWLDAWSGDWPLRVATSGRSFDRWVGELTCAMTGESLADHLIALGHGTPS